MPTNDSQGLIGNARNLPQALYRNANTQGKSPSVGVFIDNQSTEPIPTTSRLLLAQSTGRVLTTTGTSANTALTAGIKGVSIYARNSDAYYSIGNSSQTASAATGYIAQGERLDLDCSIYATPNIAVIFGAAGTAAILMVTELV
jgi:hypothetical protein